MARQHIHAMSARTYAVDDFTVIRSRVAEISAEEKLHCPATPSRLRRRGCCTIACVPRRAARLPASTFTIGLVRRRPLMSDATEHRTLEQVHEQTSRDVDLVIDHLEHGRTTRTETSRVKTAAERAIASHDVAKALRSHE